VIIALAAGAPDHRGSRDGPVFKQSSRRAASRTIGVAIVTDWAATRRDVTASALSHSQLPRTVVLGPRGRSARAEAG
jgi:hypothetical protein